MCKVIFLFLFVVATIHGVKSDEPNPADECTISFNVLHKLGTFLSAVTYRNKSFGNFSDCGEVINATLQVSSQMLKTMKREINESKIGLWGAARPLRSAEKATILQLESLLDNPTTDYEDVIIAMRIKLDDIKNEIYSQIKKSFSLNVKNDFYDLSDHQTHEEDSESCTLSNEDGHLLIANLHEIYFLFTETDLEENCEVAVGRLMNVEALINNRKIFEKQARDLMTRSYAERKRLSEILIENAKNKNFANVEHEKFEALQQFAIRFGAINAELEREVAQKAFDFAVINIQKAKRFLEIEIALEDAKPVYEESLSAAVIRAYDCNKHALGSLMMFIEFKKWECYPALLHAKEMCEHIDDPIVINFQTALKIGGFEVQEPLLYQFFASETKHQSDSSKSRNSEPFSVFTEIIGKYAKKPHAMVEIIYDEMMASGFVDTPQHVMFGFWLKKLMENTTEDTSILENIKQRLPEAIRTLVFEPKFFISTPNNDCFLPDYNVSVFTVSPANELRYIQINTQPDKVLYSTEVDNQTVTKLGTGYSGFMYQWYFVPTDNATSFYIKSAVDDKALSAETFKKCEVVDPTWLTTLSTVIGVGKPRCLVNAQHFKLHEANNLSQKWKVKSEEC